MATVGMKRARQVLRLDDEPGSPEYVLDFTDSSLAEKATLMKACVADFKLLQEAFEDPGADLRELQAKTAVTYGALISAFLGRRAYDEIVEYVTGGDPEVTREEVNVLLSPLVVYLVGEYSDALDHDKMIRDRYLGGARTL